jgi:CRP-like cAMP-binding protein
MVTRTQTIQFKQIFTLGVGEYFGEIALLQKEALRSFTIQVCMDDTHLMEINKEAFDGFVGKYKTESVKTIINFYKTCHLWSMIDDQKKVELAAKSFIIKYPSNTAIIKQNDIPYNIYFVVSGGVRLLRRIKVEGRVQQDTFTLDSNRSNPDSKNQDLLRRLH